MFSTDVKQFRLSHILVAFVLFGGAMALIASGEDLSVQWGWFFMTGLVGTSLAFGAMFVADLIDVRRMDDRKLSSRFFNGVGLGLLALTVLILLVFGAIVVFQSGIWFLHHALQWVE